MIKIAIFPKLMYRFNTIPVKIMTVFFAQSDITFIQKYKVPRIATKIWGRKRTRLKDSHDPVLKITIKLQQSGLYGTGIKTDKEINGIELRIQK